MEPHPSTSQRPILTPSARVVRQLIYDLAPASSPPIIHADVAATLAQAPLSTDRSCDTSYLVCAEEFFEDNPLIAATLQPRTRHVYSIALENFRGSP